MAAITEDDIEQAILNLLETDGFSYDIIRCSPDVEKRDDLNDGTGRSNKKQCILPQVFRESLQKINPLLSESI